MDVRRKMNVIDLFCGAGGFSSGAHLAGLTVKAAFDIDPILTSAFQRNFPDTPLHLRDIGNLSGPELLSLVPGAIDGIFGGPPCQGFSDIGRRRPSDPRRHLLGHFFRIVSQVEPTFFVMENVRGLAYADARPILDEAIASLNGRYNILGPAIMDAADYGAATRRRRLFVIGMHSERVDPLPMAAIVKLQKKPATVSQAVADLSNAVWVHDDDQGFDHWRMGRRGRPSVYAGRLRSRDGTFTGHRRTQHTEAVIERFSSLKAGQFDEVGRHPKLMWSGQCPTLRAGTGNDKGSYQSVRPLHPEEPRVITVREAARLQGFSDRHVFHPTVWHSCRMIGNSVSPPMAEAIFRSISEHLRSDLKTARDYRNDRPAFA